MSIEREMPQPPLARLPGGVELQEDGEAVGLVECHRHGQYHTSQEAEGKDILPCLLASCLHSAVCVRLRQDWQAGSKIGVTSQERGVRVRAGGAGGPGGVAWGGTVLPSSG